MICRLCLINIKVENKVSLFNEKESGDELKIIKLIAKYLFLEITQNDALSTTICQECNNHLNEFNTFCIHVERQQSTLLNEFLAIKCDMQLDLDGVEIPVESEIDESQLDIEDVLVDSLKAKFDEYSPGADDTDRFESVDDSDYDDVQFQNFAPGANEMDYESGELLYEKVTDTTSVQQPRVEKRKIPDTKRKDEFIAKYMQLKCELCQQPLNTFKDLRRHFKKIHHRKQYVICCGNRIYDQNNLYGHIQWHLNPEHFKCGECDKLFKTNSSLSGHIRTKHYKPEDLIYKCNLCDMIFPLKGSLNLHIKNQHAKKTFICEHCNDSFINQCRLDKHIKCVHDNFFPHVCDICGKKFKHKPSFDVHVLDHKGIVQPPKQCKICGEWKKTTRAVQRHIEYRHRNSPIWKCKYCDRHFKSKCNLKEHEAKHTGDYLYNCPYCVKEFRSHSNMYVHIKVKHAEERLAAQAAPDGQSVISLANTARLVIQQSVDDSIRKLFPITSEEKLVEIDRKIIPENRDQYVSTMKYLLYDSIRNLKNILSNDIVTAYNVDGSHRMKRLMSFSNFYSALIGAIEMLPTTAENDPLDLLKYAFRLQKKRQYKKKSRNIRSEE